MSMTLKMNRNDIYRRIYNALPEDYQKIDGLAFRPCKNLNSWMWGTVEDTYTPGGKIPNEIAYLAVRMLAFSWLRSMEKSFDVHMGENDLLSLVEANRAEIDRNEIAAF